jgi:hypothetical protein
MVTSNHIHLLLLDVGSRQTIPGALQLIAGRTVQEYNRRKSRIDDALKKDFHQRESRWTESVAVGSKAFIEQTRDQLGFRAKGLKTPILGTIRYEYQGVSLVRPRRLA